MCSECQPGLYEWGGKCIPCDGNSGARMFGIVVAIATAVFVLHAITHWFSRAHESVVNLKQKGLRLHQSKRLLFFFVQTAALFVATDARLNLSWLNFDFFSGPQCYSPSSPAERKILLYLIPLVCLVSCWLLALLHRVFLHSRQLMCGKCLVPQWDATDYLLTSVDLLILNYNLVTIASFEYLDCIEIALNHQFTSRVASSPGTDCNSTEYRQYLPVVWLMVVVYVILFPLFALGAIWFKMHASTKDSNSSGKSSTRALSYLSIPYSKNAPYWEFVTLLRRLILVAIVVFSTKSSVSRNAWLAQACIVLVCVHLFFRPFYDFQVKFKDNEKPLVRVVGQIQPNHVELLCLVVLASLVCLRIPLSPGSKADSALILLLVLGSVAFILVWHVFRRRGERKGEHHEHTSTPKSPGSFQDHDRVNDAQPSPPQMDEDLSTNNLYQHPSLELHTHSHQEFVQGHEQK